MIGSDGRAKKGEVKIIGKNQQGQIVSTVKWNDGTKAQVPFQSIKVDTRPAPKPVDPKGPGPMDLSSTDRPAPTCYKCQKKGHIAKFCTTEIADVEIERHWEEGSTGLSESGKGQA